MRAWSPAFQLWSASRHGQFGAAERMSAAAFHGIAWDNISLHVSTS